MGTWPRAIPTLPLVMLSDSPIGDHGTPLREEMEKRVKDGEVTGLSARMFAETLVADLRNDNERWNAHDAWMMFRILLPQGRDALERELVIGDPQSWRAAASILRQAGPTPPSEALIKACIADLHDDRGVKGSGYLRMGNASSSVIYLAAWSHIAPHYIRDAVLSEDPQQRFYAAAIAGYTGDTAVMDAAVPILISHLRDNRIPGDGQVAAAAIFRFGPPALPLLRQHADEVDTQAREAIAHIIERLEHPDRVWYECINSMPKLTDKTHDPLDMSLERALYY